MSEIKTLQNLLKHELEDLYSAEQQIIDALPSMIDTAKSRELKKSLSNHLKVTRKQKTRLDKVQKLLGAEKKENMGLFKRLFSGEKKHHCIAMEGLINEGDKMMAEDMEPEVMDAAIIAAAQKIEHYEISSYGTAKTFALQLGLKKVAALLDETLCEEYESDDLLTELAISKVNLDAIGKEEKGPRKVPGKRAPAKSNSKTAGKSPAKRKPAKTGRKKASR